MNQQTKRAVLATLIKAGRRDLARVIVAGDSIEQAFGKHPNGRKARQLVQKLGGRVGEYNVNFGDDPVYVGVAEFTSSEQVAQFEAGVARLGFDTVRHPSAGKIRVAFGPPEETRQLGKFW